MKRYTKGFTLIELLVVIAIIGILASVVLVSLNSARSKGKDTRVISDVQQMRTALESGYNGSYYPDLTNNSNGNNGSGSCTVTNWLSGGPQNTTINQLATDACTQGGANDLNVVTTGTNGAINGYAIYGKLVSNTGQAFCIDSTGRTSQAETNFTASTCQ